MDNETPQTEKSWFSDLSLKTTLVYLTLSLIGGGVTGAGVSATKAVAAQGLNQDQADVRYLTKDEANRRGESRDKQFEEIKREMVKDKVFDERTNMILKQIDLLRQERKDDREYYERILTNNR